MSANSSSSFDHPHQSPEFLFFSCYEAEIGNIIFGVFTVCITLIIVPLSITVLFLGHQQWRRHRSVKQNHSDIITYNMAVMEVFLVFGSIFYCLSVLLNSEAMRLVSSHVYYITSCGQMSLHILICVERYLAVVHPIKYRSLRQSRGDTIRNVSVGSVWLIACVEMSLNVKENEVVIAMLYTVQMALTLISISFCSLSVLRVLKRPGPGVGGIARVDRSKRRAFSTITAILGALLLRLGGSLLSTIFYTFSLTSQSVRCVVMEASAWLGLPCSLVLPLLFLHRAGKLTCCRKTNVLQEN